MYTQVLLLTLSAVASARIVNQCTQRGMYAMTWDDGPAQYTNQLLDTLASKNVKVTFHVTTKYLTDPTVQSNIQRIASSGHLIGLRAESDWNLLAMSDEQIRAGIARQANVLASFIGYTPKFIRLPYNGFDDRVLRAVESTGIIATTHNLESYDYTGDGTRTVNAIKLSLSLVGKGAGSFISIQHDGVQQSVGVAGKVVDTVKSYGYRLVKLDECLGLGDMTKNKEPLQGADDSMDLGPMAGSGDVPMAGGPSGGMGSGMPAGGAQDENDINQKGANDKNEAYPSSTFASSFGAAVMVIIAAALQF